jgi:hypothetical protein
MHADEPACNLKGAAREEGSRGFGELGHGAMLKELVPPRSGHTGMRFYSKINRQ